MSNDEIETSSGETVEQAAPKKNIIGKVRAWSSEDKGNFDALMAYAARTPPMAVILDAFIC